jgi:hypothetical protein
MAQRNLKIYVNNILYKDIMVDVDSEGNYDPVPIWSMILSDKQAGYFVDYNLTPGTFPIRIELRH